MRENRFSSLLFLYTTGLGINRFLAALLLPLLTNSLSPEIFGAWTLIQSVYLILMLFIIHGMDEAILRFATDTSDIRHDSLLTGLLAAATIAILASLIAPIPLYFVTPANSVTPGFVSLFGLWLLADAVPILAMAHFRAIERPLPVAIFLALQNIVLLGLTWLLVIKQQRGLQGLLWAHTTTALLFLLFWLPLIIRRQTAHPTFELYRKLAAFGLPLMIVNLMGLLTNIGDRFLVNAILGPQATGLYSTGYKLGMFTFLLLSAFRMAWYPKIYALCKPGDHSKGIDYAKQTLPRFLFLIGTMALAITLFATELAKLPIPGGKTLIGAEFLPGLVVAGPIALAYLFDSGATLLDAFLYFEKRTSLILIASIATLATNFVLNLLLIKHIGLQGAALATLAAYILLFILIQCFNSRILKVKILSGKMVGLLIYFTLMVFAAPYLHDIRLKTVFFILHLMIGSIVLVRSSRGLNAKKAA